ncbi:hypothetical protein PIB30_065614 [Stylosanthes scabra]|uniref:Uncharacterized protein n=1 Tax=Stylosanthes scabra TaxID=79078 RepID=A0ABU6TNN1_9FABA|nr:hypothetical protein [Stylosanthes scabra]
MAIPVADVPEGELSDVAMALEQNGTTDHRDVDGGVMLVTNSDNTDDEDMVCDSSPEAGNAAGPEKATDNTGEARTGRMTRSGAMADNTVDAVMADGTAVVIVRNTETLDTAELGQDEAAAVALAYKPAHWRAEMLDSCGADPEPEPSPCRINRTSSRSAPEKKSMSASCGVGSSPP